MGKSKYKGLDIVGYIEYEVSKRLEEEVEKALKEKTNELFRRIHLARRLSITKNPDNPELCTLNICIDDIFINDGFPLDYVGNFDDMNPEHKEYLLIKSLGAILLKKYKII